MLKEKNVIVVDIDGTLAIADGSGEYTSAIVCVDMRKKLLELKSQGYWVILYTSRNMRTHAGNIGLILKHTAPVLIEWLEVNKIPYDELHFGKPWCGHDGFYVDDRAVRPREFVTKSIDELKILVNNDRLDK